MGVILLGKKSSRPGEAVQRNQTSSSKQRSHYTGEAVQAPVRQSSGQRDVQVGSQRILEEMYFL